MPVTDVAYTPNVVVGTTLTDLGRNAVENEALSVKKQLESAAQFYQLQSRKADLEARRTEADKDRALRFFEVGQQKTLKERELDLEDKRLQTEASRWAQQFETNTGLKNRELDLMKLGIDKQFDPSLMTGRSAGDIANIAAQVADRNARAKATASRANAMLQGIVASEPDRIKQRASEWFTNTPFATREQKLKTDQDINAIFTALGEDASLIELSPDRRQFIPLEVAAPTRGGGINPSAIPPALPPQAGPTPTAGPTDMGAIPWTLIGPDNKVHTFATKEERDAALRAMQGESAPAIQSGGYLRFDPQTGTFR